MCHLTFFKNFTIERNFILKTFNKSSDITSKVVCAYLLEGRSMDINNIMQAGIAF